MKYEVLKALAGIAEDLFPAILYKSGGSRAQAAIKLIIDGKVEEIGGDLFRVSGKYTASYRENRCNCMDRAPYDAKHGKLCKHRLAIMFMQSHALTDNSEWLNNRVADIALMADGGWFELIFEKNYDRPEVQRFVGYSLNGTTTTRFTDSQNVTLEQLRKAIAPLGVGLTSLPQKLGEWDYAMRFSPDGKAKLHSGAWAHKGVTEGMIERAKWEMPAEKAAELRQGIRQAA